MKGTLLRQLPGTSVIHRLWAGTKLIAVVVIGTTLIVQPSWPVLGAVSALLLLTGVLAGASIGALPRPPLILVALVGFGAAVNAVLGLDAVLLYGRSVLFALVLLWASITLAWTTRIADVAPAVATLLAPLRWVKAPVDEWAASLALILRSLPLIVDDIVTLVAARKLRPKGGAATQDGLVDWLVVIVSATIRRATEMGVAIEARGGIALITEDRRRPGRADAVALVVVLGACAAGLAVTVAT